MGKAGEGKVYELCRKYCKHAACPVPSGIIKAIEVSCGLALFLIFLYSPSAKFPINFAGKPRDV
jgi:hypothetical protein